MKYERLLKLTVALVLGAFAWSNGENQAQESVSVTNARNLVAEQASVEDSTSAQQISAYSNDDADGFVHLSVDREDGLYKDGDKVVLKVRSNVEGYLYLINVNSKGEATLLFPNPWNRDNKISAGIELVYPTKKMGFSLRVQGPEYGQETIKAFVLPQPLELSEEATSTGFHMFSEAECQDILRQVTSFDADSKTTVPQPDPVTGKVSYTTSKDATEPTEPKRYFVGIVVSRFNDSSIRPLKLCVNDGKAVESFWLQKGGVTRENSFLLKDEDATREKIRATFANLSRKLRPGDVLVVFISTHGHIDSKDMYIVPYDGINPQNADVEEVSRSLVGSNELAHWINDMGSVKILFFVDVCHAGGMFANAKGFGDDDAPEFFFGFNRAVAKSISQDSVFGLCSSTKEELSYLSRDENGMSVFTTYLIEAFNSSNVRTHEEIKNYVLPKVKAYTKDHYYGATQTVVEDNRIEPGVVLRVSN